VRLDTNLPADADGRISFSTDMKTISFASVKKASDSGMYQCVAINTHGTTYSTAQMRILGKAILQHLSRIGRTAVLVDWLCWFMVWVLTVWKYIIPLRITLFKIFIYLAFRISFKVSLWLFSLSVPIPPHLY